MQKIRLTKHTGERLSHLYPDFGDRVFSLIIQYYERHKMKLCISETTRSFERQKNLYAQGRTEPGKIVTRSLPGFSLHHYGLAADMCFSSSDPFLEKIDQQKAVFYWNEVGRIAKECGLQWGGDFTSIKDRPHVQLDYGFKVEEIKKMYDETGLLGIWEKLHAKLKKPYGVGYVGDYVFYKPIDPRSGEKLT